MKGFLSMVGIGVAVAIAIVAWRITGLMDKRNVDTMIWVGAGALVVIVLGTVAAMFLLAERRREQEMSGYGSQRPARPMIGGGNYAPMRRQLPADLYDAYPDNQGTFQIADSEQGGWQ